MVYVSTAKELFANRVAVYMAKRKTKASNEVSITPQSADLARSRVGETVVGHEKILSDLLSLFIKGRFPQSLILVGAAGIGKSLIARRCAAQLLCRSKVVDQPMMPDNKQTIPQYQIRGCGSCPACVQLKAECHPDLHWIDVRTESGDTEHIRELIGSLTLAPFDGIARVVVLDHAELLHIAAANALLKSIEEPREGTYFIIVVSSLLSVPVTIRSRCQIFTCTPLSSFQIEGLLAQFSPAQSDQERKRIADISNGAFATALRLLEHHQDYRHTLINIFDGNTDLAAKFAKEISTLITKDKELISTYLGSLRATARFEMLNTGPVSQAEIDEEARRAYRGWATFIANSIDAEQLMVERYIPPEQVLYPLFLALAERQEYRLIEQTYLCQ